MSIYIKLLIASLFWGTNIVVMKLLLKEVPFLTVALMRVVLSCLFIGLFMLFKKENFKIKNIKSVFIISILGIYLNFVFTFLGMNEVKGIENAFLNALAPAVTIVIGFLFFKERYNKYEYIAFGVSVLAFLISIRFQVFSLQLGFYYLFIGMICYMIGNMLISKQNVKRNLTFVFYQLLLSVPFLIVHATIKDQISLAPFFELSWWLILLFIVVSGIGFAWIQASYLEAIEKIGVLKTSMFLSINPIITYIESLIFLNEDLDFIHIISFACVSVSFFLVYKQKVKQ